MAKGVNKAILLGNVGGDPEVRYTPQGSAVANITIATSEKWKDKQTGQEQERTEWHRIVFFNRLAEVVGEYVRKGMKLYIEGQIRTRQWEQDGVKRYTTEIVASEMQLLDNKNSGNGQAMANQQAASYQQQRPAGIPQNTAPATQQAPAGGFDDSFDDDIPF